MAYSDFSFFTMSASVVNLVQVNLAYFGLLGGFIHPLLLRFYLWYLMVSLVLFPISQGNKEAPISKLSGLARSHSTTQYSAKSLIVEYWVVEWDQDLPNLLLYPFLWFFRDREHKHFLNQIMAHFSNAHKFCDELVWLFHLDKTDIDNCLFLMPVSYTHLTLPTICSV